jgi:deoxyribodipyrimidine photo-lyase
MDTMHEPAPAIAWYRRDLRVHDHPALSAALSPSGPGSPQRQVIPVFVLDDALLGGRWVSPNRTWFMLGALRELTRELEARGSGLVVRRGDPVQLLPEIARAFGAREVHVSRDYAPYGRRRDEAVDAALRATGARLVAHPGVLIHEPEDVLTREARRFAVFTPYRRAWERVPLRSPLPAPRSIPAPAELRRWVRPDDLAPGGGTSAAAPLGAIPTAEPGLLPEPGEAAARDRLARWLRPGSDGLDGYAARRDLPGESGTSRLSADLRWGTLSPLEVLVRAARPGSGPATFASELAWRDFYAHLLWWEPRLIREPFDRRTDRLAWRDDPISMDAWREGRTGYPIVDAAMRQLRASGWMHNRARMIVASFLAKDLMADWRSGEAHFMEHLVDGDVASNGGGWQWAASVGTDAQPWFRIFNPVAQGRRFDPEGRYVRRWLPELARVPVERIHEPWRMTPEEQAAADCRIGRD